MEREGLVIGEVRVLEGRVGPRSKVDEKCLCEEEDEEAQNKDWRLRDEER